MSWYIKQKLKATRICFIIGNTVKYHLFEFCSKDQAEALIEMQTGESKLERSGGTKLTNFRYRKNLKLKNQKQRSR